MNVQAMRDALGAGVLGLREFSIPLAIVAAAVVAGLVLSSAIVFVLRRLDAHIDPDKTNVLIDGTRWRAPLNLLVPALSVAVVLPALSLSDDTTTVIRHVLSVWTIGAVSFLFVRGITIGRDLVLERYDITTRDNLQARAVHTQVNVIVRLLVFAVLIVAAASVLMTFEKVRQIGVSLLASAGLAGVVIGFAAQRSIATVIAGIQIAITQPIRVDDVVIVENEWGRIEEITLTYVVVRIWDLRRLILPITHFIEKPFQNWTRVSADILGTVYIYADYTMPVEPLRKELRRLVEQSPLWDKKVCGMQVTNTTDKTVEIRGLMSTEDASKGWDLRCHVREKLIEFLQRNYPEHLPRVRIDVARDNGASIPHAVPVVGKSPHGAEEASRVQAQ